ncbi:tyrosine-type recombinase/integrase [Rhizobium leucaenae]|uniref:tyrosine-type recombinase/integrase n=1 Tax=Rhizobium leucaenae TaxID=29450 RepID=UPI0007EE53ED|nr:site-specific integrase [Rhizobium leucaenae]
MATIRKRKWTNKSGAHEAWVLNYMDASGQRHREQFDKKRDAESRRVEVEGQVRSGTYRPDAATTTVQKACENFDKYMTDRKDRGEKVTEEYLQNIQGHLWNYIAPKADRHVDRKTGKKIIDFPHGINDEKLAQLTPKRCGKFRDDLREFGCSVPTTRQILGTLSRVLQHAVADDLVAVNAAAKIRVVGKRNEGSKKIKPPSKEALAAVIKAAEGDFQTKIIFAAATGIRASELHALRWRHIDLKAGVVTIETRVSRKLNEGTTKSEAGLREVPLGAVVVNAMKAWKLKTTFKGDDHLVFPNSKGNFESHTNMRKRVFDPIVERAGEKMKASGKKFVRFGWHGLRHFAISTWIEAGLQPKTVQTFAGHSSLAVTMDRYGHLFPSESHRNAMNRIASSLFTNGA